MPLDGLTVRRRRQGQLPGRRHAIRSLAFTALAAASQVRFGTGVARVAAPAAGLKFFTAREAAQLDVLGDALVPGARAAGLSRYLDRYASVDPESSLLMLRYLDVPPPYGDFYRSGLRRLGAFEDPQQAARRLAHADPLFYFALRSDAIDVTFGTRAGFAALDVPYLPHIAPAVPW